MYFTDGSFQQFNKKNKINIFILFVTKKKKLMTLIGKIYLYM